VTEKNESDRMRMPYLLPPTTPPIRTKGSCECQVLRSMCDWSGCNRTEDSIATASYDLICSANHFIYIENQFFISSTAPGVQNQVAQAIVDRIIRAAKNKTTFRVIVVLPNHPEGSVFSPEIKIILKWTYETISRGETSIFGQLKKAGIEPSDYISFHQLRNWGILDQGPISNQIYVHCKCIIVDDIWTIIGSANINDRSLLGIRDSEMAVVTRDNNQIEITMDGEKVLVSRFAHTLRMALWREHLGLSDTDADNKRIRDPISDSTYFGVWKQISASNTRIHASVFPNTPCDEYPTLKDFARAIEARATKPVSPEELASLKTISGFLLDFPHEFLAKENLSPSASDVAIKVLDQSVFN
jgi:phospholipase D1/2